MKRFFYMIAAAAFVFAACEREIEPTTPSSGNYFPDGKVKVSFTATYPDLFVETKAMAQAPVINELYVALFGSEGSFQAWIKAQTQGFTTNYVDHTTKANYVVYLPITDRPRRLHFVANPPKDEDGNVIYPAFGDEDEVINAMVKYKGGKLKNGSEYESEDAYWQKIVLDQIDADPLIAPDANGYYRPSTELNAALNDVCLVRNYAKVHVRVKEATSTEPAQPYELMEYALINVPGSGSVAPWNTGSAQYEPLYMNIMDYVEEDKGVFYEKVSGKYFGYMPDMNDIITTCPTSFVPVTNNASDGDYMYERTMFNRQSAPNSQTGFLAHIKWLEETEVKNNTIIPAGKEYWYKIEIHGPDGEYIPFLRTILYSIMIEGINETGYDTAEEAAAGDFAGDISIGLALSSLNELSNGSSTIRVNHTEFTSNGQKEMIDGVEKVPDYVIEWQYFPTSGDASGTPVTTVGEGTIGGEDYDVTVSMYDLTSKSAIDCNLSYLIANQLGTVTHSDGSTWGTITVPISELGETTKTSVVRISGQYGTSRRIFREVIINVVGKQDFVNVQGQSTDPNLPKTTYIEADEYDGLNKKVVVHFSLPDSLGASLFPLNIKIEAEANNLTSTSPDLPVNSGVSAFNDSNNSFYFIKTVTLDEYRYIEDGQYKYNNDFTAVLFTNQVSGNSTDIKLSDEKGFMNPAALTLTADKILSVDMESQTVAADAISATVNITSNIAWTIDDSSLPTGWSVTPTSSTSTTLNTTAVRFTFPANTSATVVTEAITGTVTLSAGSGSTGKPISVKQEGSAPTVTINVNSSTFGNNDNTETVNGVTLSFTGSQIRSRNSGYLELNDNSNFVVSIASGTITGVVIQYTDYNHGRSGRNNNYSSSNPATTSGYVYATNNGTTGTWTGSASSITFNMRRYSNGNYTQISSIKVTYTPN